MSAVGEQREPDLVRLVRELPPEAEQEVRDFVEFLLARQGRKADRKLRQDWAGALSNYRDQYTSVELQHRALEWRTEELQSGA